MSYRLAPAAKRDLTEIWEHIARDSETAADAFIDRWKERCELLGRSPRAGRNRDDLKPGLRSFTYGEYLIFYRVGPPGVRIVRVIHGRRDLSRLIN